MSSPLVTLRNQDVASKVLQDLVHFDGLPEHLAISIECPHRTRRRAKEEGTVPRKADVRDNGSAVRVVRLAMCSPRKVERFVDIGNVPGEKPSDEGCQRVETTEAGMMTDGLQQRCHSQVESATN